jgi:hypothetical protein
MKTVTLSYDSLTADEMRVILTCGDIWFKRTAKNASAFLTICENGDGIRHLQGEASHFGDETDFEST